MWQQTFNVWQQCGKLKRSYVLLFHIVKHVVQDSCGFLLGPSGLPFLVIFLLAACVVAGYVCGSMMRQYCAVTLREQPFDYLAGQQFCVKLLTVLWMASCDGCSYNGLVVLTSCGTSAANGSP